MKKIRQILVVLFAITMIISCDKEENVPQDTLSVEKISAKWIIDGTSMYKSFEFNKSGNYIIVKNDSSELTNKQLLLFGTYEITDNETLVLSDFGKIKISDISDKSIVFSVSLTTNPSAEVVINASKHDEIPSTTRTDLLCRTWELLTIDGETIADTEYELSVLFSASGTYFVAFANSSEENIGGLAQWKWKDDSQTKLLYSWDEVPEWDEDEFVEISVLTSDSLKIIEDENIYVFKPKLNIKSSTKQSVKIISTSDLTKMTSTGFLKK